MSESDWWTQVTWIWINPATGEYSETPVDGWLMDYVGETWSPHEEQPDSEWLGDWITRKLAQIEGEEKALTAAYQDRIRSLRARRSAINYRYGQRLEVVTGEALQGSKKKSVAWAAGKTGWRKKRGTEVTDESAAILWAQENAPEAVKYSDPSLLVSKLPKEALEAGDVPGVAKKQGDEFYLRISKGDDK